MTKLHSHIFIILAALSILYGCGLDNSGQAIEFAEEDILLEATAGSYTVNYTAPESIVITSATAGDNWITEISTSESGKIHFEYEANTSQQDRETVIRINTASSTAYLSVTQKHGNTNPDFSISVGSVNDYTVDFGIEYLGETETRNFFGAETYSAFSQISGVQNFINYQLEKLRKTAESEGVSFEELLKERTFTTSVDSSLEGLESETEYILYCCSIDTEGNIVSELAYETFSTKEPIAFNLKTDINGPVVTLSTDPDYDDRGYYFDAFSVGECGSSDNIEETLLEIIREELDFYAWSEGITVEEYLDNILTYGDGSKRRELYAETAYYGFAVCLSSSVEVASPMEIVEFTTDKVQPSDNIIEITISNLTRSGCDYAVTTTNDDTYLFFIDLADNWKDYDDESLMENIAGTYPTTSFGRSGNAEGTVTTLEPGKEYIAFAFGCVAGTPTTDLTRVYFTTLD